MRGGVAPVGVILSTLRALNYLSSRSVTFVLFLRAHDSNRNVGLRVPDMPIWACIRVQKSRAAVRLRVPGSSFFSFIFGVSPRSDIAQRAVFRVPDWSFWRFFGEDCPAIWGFRFRLFQDLSRGKFLLATRKTSRASRRDLALQARPGRRVVDRASLLCRSWLSWS